MQEQTAVLVQHQNEWLLVTDDDEPERAWEDLDAALGELLRKGGRQEQNNTVISEGG